MREKHEKARIEILYWLHTAAKVFATLVTASIFIFGFFTLGRGLFSYFVPVGLECRTSRHFPNVRPCVFGPGVVETQECENGEWQGCEPPKPREPERTQWNLIVQ